MIREGVFRFPVQTAFDIEVLRKKDVNIAEIPELAIYLDFEKTGGAILLPLMKFLHQFGTEFSDTRHLVIAVNPKK